MAAIDPRRLSRIGRVAVRAWNYLHWEMTKRDKRRWYAAKKVDRHQIARFRSLYINRQHKAALKRAHGNGDYLNQPYTQDYAKTRAFSLLIPPKSLFAANFIYIQSSYAHNTCRLCTTCVAFEHQFMQLRPHNLHVFFAASNIDVHFTRAYVFLEHIFACVTI